MRKRGCADIYPVKCLRLEHRVVTVVNARPNSRSGRLRLVTPRVRDCHDGDVIECEQIADVPVRDPTGAYEPDSGFHKVAPGLEAWIRRRLRAYLWRQWQNGPNRFK